MRDPEACRWCEIGGAAILLGIGMVLAVLLRTAAGMAIGQFLTGRTSDAMIGVAACLFIATFASACLLYSFVLARYGFMGPIT